MALSRIAFTSGSIWPSGLVLAVSNARRIVVDLSELIELAIVGVWVFRFPIAI